MLRLTTLLCLAACLQVAAADPFLDGLRAELAPVGEGRSLLGPSEADALTQWSKRHKDSSSIVDVANQPFTQALRLYTAAKRNKYFDDGVDWKVPGAMAKDDLVYVTFTARSVESAAESGESVAYLVIKGDGKGKGEMRKYFSVGPEWQRFSLRFNASRDLPAGSCQIHIWTGDQAQTMELGGLALLNFGTTGKAEVLPKTKLKLDYDGRADDAAWRSAAAARIETLRKNDLAISVTTADGKPVAGAQVHIAQTRHQFRFGMTVIGQKIITEPSYGAFVEATATQLGLSTLVFANDLKPGPWRGGGPFTPKRTLEALAWVKERGFATRGHTLLWGPRYLTKEQKALLESGDKDALQASLLAHIADCVSRTAPFIDAWDVHNEHFTYRDLTTLLGTERAAEWFTATRAANPTARLFWNENCILSSGPQTALKTADSLEWIAKIRELGAPLDGIGMQSHMGMSATSPEELLRRVDRFAALGVVVESTEFDVGVADPSDAEQQAFQRDYVRDFLTALFSHDKVVGINHWSPILGEAYTKKACLVKRDGTLLPSGAAWTALVRDAWWTDITESTDAAGTISLRGFKGSYSITVTHGDQSQVIAVELGDEPAAVQVRLE
ncbi:MAG: endo-1,4-beta-xylanase [Planctomycetota bacterium]|jgi:endo-1,4-beta-xylanase|nr:endo-1,4-beta-xylanase [Planctomycetota bacterium]